MAPELNSFLSRTRSARKIIVVDFGFLGDSVHLVPALWEIKRHYPQAEIHTLSATVGAEVLKLAPCVDHAWAFPLTPQSPPWWRHWNIFSQLRREKFDIAFNFNGADRTIVVTRLIGSRWSLAHEAGRRHFWNRLFIPEWVPRQSRELPIYEQRRQVLAQCGFQLEPARFDLKTPPESIDWSLPKGLIHLSVSASTPMKEWPLENWIGLAKKLLQHNPQCHLVATGSGSEREVERIHQLQKAVGDGRLRCFSGLTIGRLAALLQRCQLHVGLDSGVLHLAVAVGIPTLSIFREYPGMKEWLAGGPQHRYLTAPCQCIERGDEACLAGGTSQCLGKISVDQVFAEICRAR